MPEPVAPDRVPPGRQDTAVATLGAWLAALPGAARPLGPGELRTYAARGVIVGWRLEVNFSDGARRFDLLADSRFPRGPLRVALVDRPAFLTWPHVEKDGVLCLLPGNAEVAMSEPAAVAANLLGAACELIEDSVAGRNADDFRTEFLSYWNWAATERAPEIRSLLAPAPPTRVVRVWRGQGFYLLGDSEPVMLDWLRNLFGETKPPRPTTEAALLLWLDQPLPPREYPRTAADVLALARTVGPEAAAQLERIAVEQPEKIIVALGSATSNGPCLAGLTLAAPRTPDRGSRRGPDPLTAGFRPGRVPPSVLAKRFFGGTAVLRSSMNRVDPAWIHGRGQDPRFAALSAATVVVLGCGSVGGPVALALAESGVGRIVLIDPDTLTWANVGRHPLGAESVGFNKAQALARLIQARFPHVDVKAHPRRWEDVARAEPDLLSGCDLIVSAMGDWAAEGALNEWHLAAGRPVPVVYGWTEPHACAGHAVAIKDGGGCLQCGITDTGQPLLTLTEWPDSGVLRQEPACGALYQPYGPVELAHVVALVAELALDGLLGVVTASTHRIWAGRRRLLEMAGGTWTAAWIEIARDRLDGGFVHERPWPASAACGECRRAEAA